MKYLCRFALLALVILAFTGCSSTGTSTTTASGDPVPGEKKDEDSRLQPGSGTGPNASVKW